MIKEAIAALRENNDLTAEQTAGSFDELMSGEATQAQMAAFLMGLASKGETPTEITECARIMREKCDSIEPDTEVLEIVGTGGDQVGTFNISTASAIVTAAAGVPTAKHGNAGVSSPTGASDVLGELGIKIDLDKEKNKQVLDKTNICFMFAPVYHTSMKYVAPVRKDLGIPTIFNILGPLANPANATNQILGVYSDELIEPMAEALSNLGVKNGLVVHGSDGLDEITLTGPTHGALIKDGEITEITINPEEYGFELCSLDELIGGEKEENAQIIRDIFSGKETGSKKDIVCLNAGLGLFLVGKADSIEDGIKLAKEMIESGKALEKLNEFINETNSVA